MFHLRLPCVHKCPPRNEIDRQLGNQPNSGLRKQLEADREAIDQLLVALPNAKQLAQQGQQGIAAAIIIAGVAGALLPDDDDEPHEDNTGDTDATQDAPTGVPRAKVAGVPESSDTVPLWKAPAKGRSNAAQEVVEGYDPKTYPGDGPYFATDKTLAEDFQWRSGYSNGLQEINIPRSTFDELVHKGVIQKDTLYNHKYGESGGSWHVPSNRLPEFNQAIKNLRNKYHPQN